MLSASEAANRYKAERMSSRNAIIMAAFTVNAIAYVSRSSLSVMLVPMSAEFGWAHHEVKGHLLSAFFYGYICTNFCGALLCRRIGAKPVLGCSVAGWSMCTLLVPAAASRSVSLIWRLRVLTGVFQGSMFSSVFHIYGTAIPAKERARAVALLNAGSPIGVALFYALAPLIEQLFGWRGCFHIAGLTGLPWLMLWLRMEVDPPPTTAVVGPGGGYSRNVIVTAKKLGTKGCSMPIGSIVTTPCFLAIGVTHFAYAWGGYVLLTWLPTYMSEGLGMTASMADRVGALPYLGIAIVVVFGGPLWIFSFPLRNASSSNPHTMVDLAGVVSDRLLDQVNNGGKRATLSGFPDSGTGDTATARLLRVRKIMTAAGMLPSALALVLIGWTPSTDMAALLLTLAMVTTPLTSSGALCNHLDISSELAGVLYGITNSLATMAGVLGVECTAMLLDRGWGWATVFYVVAILQTVGTALFLIFGKATKVFD